MSGFFWAGSPMVLGSGSGWIMPACRAPVNGKGDFTSTQLDG